MWIPRDLIMMILGAVIFIVIASFYEIIFDYSKMKEQKEKPKRKGWIKRGWKNMIRDLKKKKKKKKKEGENTYRKKIERERLHKSGLVE